MLATLGGVVQDVCENISIVCLISPALLALLMRSGKVTVAFWFLMFIYKAGFQKSQNVLVTVSMR